MLTMNALALLPAAAALAEIPTTPWASSDAWLLSDNSGNGHLIPPHSPGGGSGGGAGAKATGR